MFNRLEPNAVAASLYYDASGTSFEEAVLEPEDLDAPCCTSSAQEFVFRHEDRRDSCVLVASEPLTDGRADWISVPENHMLIITKEMQTLCVPIGETCLAAEERMFVEFRRRGMDPPVL